MLQVRDMRMPEYEDDLPTSDVEQRLNPAEKYAQIGDVAAEILLSSTFATLPSGLGPCVAPCPRCVEDADSICQDALHRSGTRFAT